MSEDTRPDSWKKQDRDRAPCPACGTPLRDISYGNGGWMPCEMPDGTSHGDTRCIRTLVGQRDAARAQVKVLEERLITLQRSHDKMSSNPIFED